MQKYRFFVNFVQESSKKKYIHYIGFDNFVQMKKQKPKKSKKTNPTIAPITTDTITQTDDCDDWVLDPYDSPEEQGCCCNEMLTMLSYELKNCLRYKNVVTEKNYCYDHKYVDLKVEFNEEENCIYGFVNNVKEFRTYVPLMI
jgi:hypothetical protein